MAVSDKKLDMDFSIQGVNADILDNECEKEIKIIILGEIDSGKSSLIKIFFGENSPQIILSKNLEPTIGAEINVFEKKNTKIGVFDLAGQELTRWLSSKNGDMFYETDGVFMFYTLSNNLKKKDIERTSKKIKQLLKNYAPKCQCTIILNKYDDFINTKKGNLKKANQIKKMVEEISGFPTYLSSLTPNYYPLLQLKLDRIIGTMPVDPPNMALSPTNSIIDPPLSPLNEHGAHIVKGMHLADSSHLFQEEYDERISRMEVLRSEFSMGR
jgi:GTPase SAR1 family protein